MTNTKQFILSVDYELFFGHATGSPEQCLIAPTEALINTLERHGQKLCLFVDAGYLARLNTQQGQHSVLSKHYQSVQKQLTSLSKKGHDIQLHIHPHWEDCHFSNGAWQMDTSRYRLHDFNKADQSDLIARYKAELEVLGDQEVFAYRAGGWCMQPFKDISESLSSAGVWLDSTAYSEGLSEDPLRWFDFRGLPVETHWPFASDPCSKEAQGHFIELPISTMKVSPLFFWKMALIKKLFKQPKHTAFGDGAAMTANTGYYLDRLLKSSYSPASIDGLKSGLLSSAYKQFIQQGTSTVFNVMGHPKSITPDSLKQLDLFLGKHSELEATTFQDFQHLKPASK